MVKPSNQMPSSLRMNKTLDDWLNALNQEHINLGLAHVQTVHQKLNLKPIQTITVAGTNGKGSTVALLTALLKTQGLKVGAFTSPHIFQFNERVAIDSEPVSDALLVAAFERVEQARGDIELSYFEWGFLVACCVFESEQVDVQVMEVGLGGRLDAVNVLDADAAIITGIDKDHCGWLGDDLESIGFEKAGVLRAGQVAVFGAPIVPQSVTDHANEIACPLMLMGQDYHFEKQAQAFDFKNKEIAWQGLQLPGLQGDWQIQNAAAAIQCLCALGYPLTATQVNDAMAGVVLKGRLQTLSQRPWVVIDVAHNAQSVKALAQWLKSQNIKGSVRAVFSVLKDKNVGSWLSEIAPWIDHWFVFELAGDRALPAHDLKMTLADHVGLFSFFESGAKAREIAAGMTADDDLLLVFGSFHVLDEVYSVNG